MRYKEHILFLAIFLLIGFFASQLFIYFDDVTLIFPAIYRNYLGHLPGYIRDNGIFRPLALVYYYYIFTVYNSFPQIAHMIPVVIFFGVIVLLFTLLRMQKVTNGTALLFSLIGLSLPMATESFAWFSASVGIFAIAIFLLQIYFIETEKLSGRLFIRLFLLQATAALVYESTIFMPLGLAYFLVMKNKHLIAKHKLLLFIGISMLLLIPVIVYFNLQLLFPSLYLSRLQRISPDIYLANWASSLRQLSSLFTSNALYNFWLAQAMQGFYEVISLPLILLYFMGIIIYCFYLIFLKSTAIHANSKRGERADFWILCLLLSILPLGWQPNYLAFRTLLLPTLLFIIILARLFDWLLRLKLRILAIIKIAIFMLIFFFLAIQIGMTVQYREQYRDDLKLAKEIDTISRRLKFSHQNRTNLIILNFPNSTVAKFVYGDFIFSAFHHVWTAEAFMDLHSGNTGKIAIEYGKERIFSSQLPKDEFYKKRPLTILHYRGKNDCWMRKCFNVTYVL